MLDGEEYFTCKCGSDEHTLRFILDLDNSPNRNSKYPRDPELFTSVFLNHYDYWYKRLWRGIKYIFGYKCKYGHWDSFTLQTEDAERLIDMVQQFVDARKECEVKPGHLVEKQAENEERKAEIADKLNMLK